MARVGDQRHLARALATLGERPMETSRPGEARALYEEALAPMRTDGDRGASSGLQRTSESSSCTMAITNRPRNTSRELVVS